MEKANDIDIVDADLTPVEFTPEELESTDINWKEKAQELQGRVKRHTTQLGKVKVKLGEYETKLKELTPKPKPQDKKEPDDKLLERFDKMALKISGITEADEIELFNKWKDQTGREADDIVGNEVFTKELENLRTAKANLKATSDIRGEGDRSGGAKNTPEYWIAKATKGKDGNLEFPEETPKELFGKIVNKISENEPSQSQKLKFYNE